MPRKSSSSAATPLASRSYMSPTASSMAKMSRSTSVGDGLNAPDPAEDPTPPPATTSSQVKEAAPPFVAVVPSNAALVVPPHAAVVPVVASSPLSNHGNQTAPPRGLQARVPGSSRPLPDKPSLASFSPSNNTGTTSSISSSRPPPVSVSPLTPPQHEEEEEPQTPADRSAQQSDETGLDSHLPPPFILSSLHLCSGLRLCPTSSSSSLHSSSPCSGEMFHTSCLFFVLLHISL